MKAYKDALKKVKGPKTKNALQRAVGAVAHKFTFATLEGKLRIHHGKEIIEMDKLIINRRKDTEKSATAA